MGRKINCLHRPKDSRHASCRARTSACRESVTRDESLRMMRCRYRCQKQNPGLAQESHERLGLSLRAYSITATRHSSLASKAQRLRVQEVDSAQDPLPRPSDDFTCSRGTFNTLVATARYSTVHIYPFSYGRLIQPPKISSSGPCLRAWQ